MLDDSELPEVISVFPLPGALLLPRARLPLHLFETRYLAMLDDVMKTDERIIGMVQPDPAGGSITELHRIGCAGRVSAMSETEDGRYMITLTGLSRFRLGDEVEAYTPYRQFRVSWAGFEADTAGEEADPGLDRAALMDLLARYFEDHGVDTDWDGIKAATPEFLINSLSMLCPFGPDERQALLEAPRLTDRRETLMTLIEYALHRGSNKRQVMQ